MNRKLIVSALVAIACLMLFGNRAEAAGAGGGAMDMTPACVTATSTQLAPRNSSEAKAAVYPLDVNPGGTQIQWSAALGYQLDSITLNGRPVANVGSSLTAGTVIVNTGDLAQICVKHLPTTLMGDNQPSRGVIPADSHFDGLRAIARRICTLQASTVTVSNSNAYTRSWIRVNKAYEAKIDSLGGSSDNLPWLSDLDRSALCR